MYYISNYEYTGASLSGIIISKCSEGFCSIDAAASLPVLSGVNTPVYSAIFLLFKNIIMYFSSKSGEVF